MNKNIVTGVVVLILIIAGVWYYQDQKAGSTLNDPIKIGLIMPMSGELAAFGNNVREGIEIALEQSGVASSSVQIIAEDSGGFTTNGALTAFKKLVEQDKVDVIFGPFGSSATLTVAPEVASSTLKTVIAISSCDERFVNYPTLFCVYPGISAQVDHGVEFMKQRGWKKVAFITENSDIGLKMEERLKGNQAGVEVVAVERVVSNQTKDLRTVITKLLAAKPDVVYAMMAPTEGFIFFRQYPVLSKGVPLYIGSDVNKDQLKELFGDEAKNIYFAGRMSEDYDDTFVNAFKASQGKDPDYFAALGHSAAATLLGALKGNKFNLDGIIDEMISTEGENMAVPGFRFNPDRTVYVPLHSYEFKGGDFVEVK